MAKFVRLHYYDIRGEAEVLRLLFKATNIKFEDKRYSEAEWQEAKSAFKIQDLPLVENFDGRLLTEPSAISRYFSLNRGFMGSNEWEYYLIEKCIESIQECCQLLNDVVYKSSTLDETQLSVLADNLKSLNKLAETNSSGFIVGKAASLADIYLLVLLDYADMRAVKHHFSKAKKLANVKTQMIKAFPDVGKWITTMRPITDS